MHKNDHSPPPAVFVGRMQYAPTLLKNLKSKKQERIRYPCRGVLHTPHKYPIKDHYTLHKYTSSSPPAAFVGRMQYAPTLLENLKSKKRERIMYPCRGVLHTPHKYSIKDHYTLHKYTSSPPPAAFLEAYAIRLYRITGMKSEK